MTNKFVDVQEKLLDMQEFNLCVASLQKSFTGGIASKQAPDKH